MLPLKCYTRRHAFTLIELLTVIAVFAILAAILIPALGMVRHRANSAKSISNLRQIGTSVALYTVQNKGVLPLLNRNAKNVDSTEPYFWAQALETEILDWDRSVSGTHPIFVDPTATLNHQISDYGASTYTFLDANPNNPGRSTNGLNVNSLSDPSKTLVVCTSYAKNSGRASWYVQGGFANGAEPINIPEARLNDNQIGVVFADGHTELLDYEKVYGDLEYRQRLFDPKAN
jgi:prepilin-type N-terminal cleavage/methylation domain-containing protein